jgi:hypothetical protein
VGCVRVCVRARWRGGGSWNRKPVYPGCDLGSATRSCTDHLERGILPGRSSEVSDTVGFVYERTPRRDVRQCG